LNQTIDEIYVLKSHKGFVWTQKTYLFNDGTKCGFVREMQQNCDRRMLLPENICVDYLLLLLLFIIIYLKTKKAVI
jgi:hypothetical protein